MSGAEHVHRPHLASLERDPLILESEHDADTTWMRARCADETCVVMLNVNLWWDGTELVSAWTGDDETGCNDDDD